MVQAMAQHAVTMTHGDLPAGQLQQVADLRRGHMANRRVEPQARGRAKGRVKARGRGRGKARGRARHLLACGRARTCGINRNLCP